MPVRLTPLSLAIPLPFVTALPAGEPLSVKETVLPLTGLPPEVSVAERVVVPPHVPVAGATARLVGLGGATSVKQTCTLDSGGVTAPGGVDRNALYFR